MGYCVGCVAFFVETTADYGPLWLESTSARSPAMGSCVGCVAFFVETTADYVWAPYNHEYVAYTLSLQLHARHASSATGSDQPGVVGVDDE